MEVRASPARWQQVQRLFAEVVGLAPERCEARLERACRDDPALREAVQALLDQHAGGDRGASGRELDGLPAPSKRSTGPMPASEDDPLGELINGRYRLLSELGRGAMGVVYKAEDTKLRCYVTLKFLHAHLAADRKARDRFIDEARAASDLHHPNICQVKDHDEAEDGRLFLVMAYYGGETLEKIIERGPLPVEQAVDIARQVAAGLAAAHQPTELRPHGIIHRDIKPSNILVADKGKRAIILDFGIAKMTDSGLTGTGTVLGTPAYMSPEHLHGQVDRGTDLWALGVVLYEMLAGERPFQADYGGDLHNVILHHAPPSLAKYRKRIPRALGEVVRRCLEKDPEARYPSAEEIEAELKQIEKRSTLDWTARAAGRLARRMRLAARRRRMSVAMLALGVPALALVLLLSPVRTEIADRLDGAPNVQHLAVLPLLSPADASIGEGLTLTLTSLLTQLGAHAERAITVVPASEMREIETVAEARERFDVDIVVSGNFRQDGDEVHLTLNLIDARNLHQIDGDQITEPASRLPVLQRRSLAALAEMLKAPLSEEVQDMISAGGTTDPEAYALYLKAEAALQHLDKPEQTDTAIQLFQWTLQNDSLYALAHAGLGNAYRQKYDATREPGWIDLAEWHCARALALADRLAPVRVTLGRLYARTGDYEKAVAEFNLALALEPLSATAHYGLGGVYRALGQNEKAEAEYRKAIALQPQVWAYYGDLGRLYLEMGRFESAIAQYERVIALAPDNLWGYNGLGAAYLYLDDMEQAEAMFRRSNDLQPTSYAYSNLGVIYYYQKRYTEAARAYERALAEDSSQYHMWANLAGAYERSGKSPETVRAAYQRAARGAEAEMDINPRNAYVLYDLASYSAQLGQPQRARDLLEQALQASEGNVLIMGYAGILYEQLGLREQALDWIGKALRAGFPQKDLEDEDLDDLRRDPRFIELLRAASTDGHP